MFSRKIFLLIACLLVVTNSGCTFKVIPGPTIESESIQAMVDNPSGSEMPLKKGQTITIWLKEGFSSDLWDGDHSDYDADYIGYIKMVVKDANNTRIIGKIDFVCCIHSRKDAFADEVVEVKLEDIEWISTSHKEWGVAHGSLGFLIGLILPFIIL